MRPRISMLSDFGHRDAYVGTMKSVILGICPDAALLDLCHDVPAQNVMSGAHILATATPFIATGTIVLAVVDPGVGSNRRAVAVETQRLRLVGPDNGLFSEVFELDPPRRAVELTNPAYHLENVSHTFHGRDIFSPAAAHLANGVDFDELGGQIDVASLIRLPEIGPLIKDASIECRVTHIDHFGNVITNLRREVVDQLGRTVRHVQIKGDRAPFHQTFAAVPDGEPVCYFNSTGYFELGVRNRSAAEQFELTQRQLLHVSTASS